MISSDVFAHDFDKRIIENVVAEMDHKTVEVKALIGEAFLRGMLFGIYHSEGTSGKQD